MSVFTLLAAAFPSVGTLIWYPLWIVGCDLSNLTESGQWSQKTIEQEGLTDSSADEQADGQ